MSTPAPVTRIYANARVATCRDAGAGAPAAALAAELRVLRSVAAVGERIAAVGEPAQIARRFPGAECIDAAGRLLTPGLIDCHTHIVYGGHRADEFERRRAGESYASIARAGGGILASVRATRALDEEQLAAAALPRVDALLADGVTTLEIKSGYGLTLPSEMTQLRAARRIGALRAVSVVTSFLGAHALPPEAQGDADAYIERLCAEWLPAIAAAGLADAVDAFCEHIAFTPEQVARVFARAGALGLPVKLHADQLTNQHAAALAARCGALSADHLEHTDTAGIDALARAGTVAVLLPGAYHFLNEKQLPPVAALRRSGVPLAVATDCNPGSSPLTSLLTALQLASHYFGLDAAECLHAVTRVAARALGLEADRGTIEAGKRCDLALWEASDPAELVHGLGQRLLRLRVVGGTGQRMQ
ncbi:MAG: imidazolonepropionase [Gammaproteobacteria bacterium]|nr:imidazolonepropionase [Gammaproteobacteria bacterium]